MVYSQIGEGGKHKSKCKQSREGTVSSVAHLVLHYIFQHQPPRFHEQVEQHYQTDISEELFDKTGVCYGSKSSYIYLLLPALIGQSKISFNRRKLSLLRWFSRLGLRNTTHLYSFNFNESITKMEFRKTH